MGIDLRVTFAHRLDASAAARVSEAAAASTAITDAAAALHAVLAPRWRALPAIGDFAVLRCNGHTLSPSRITALWSADGAVEFEWAGFSIYFARRAVVMTHLEKFGAFIDGALGLQGPLRRACHALVTLVGSDAAIYGADSTYPTERTLEWACSGRSFEWIVDALHSHAGPPAASIAACARVTTAGRAVDGWYLDRFEALR